MALLIDCGGSKTIMEFKGETYRGKGYGLAFDSDTKLESLENFLRNSKIVEADKVIVNLGGKNVNQIKNTILSLFPSADIYLYRESEGFVAKALAKRHQAGAVLFAGTGSIAFGYDSDRDKLCICGGWGKDFSDGGSGYYIGLETIKECLNELDGIFTPGALTQAVTGHSSIVPARTNGLEICEERDGIRDKLFHKTRSEIAKITETTVKYAKKGDSLAINIINRAGSELGKLVKLALNKCEGTNKKVLITGGLSSFYELWQNYFLKNCGIAKEQVIIIKNGIMEGLRTICQQGLEC